MKIVIPAYLFGCMTAVISIRLYTPVDWTTIQQGAFAGFIIVTVVVASRQSDKPGLLQVIGVLLPWMIAAVALANGALDRSEERRYSTAVIQPVSNRRSMFYDTLIVRSWRPGRTSESLTVWALQPFFSSGDRVTVGVRSGALGLEWISGVSR